MRRILATIAAFAFMALAAPASASTPGDLSVSGLPRSVIDRGGSVTLRVKYACLQYSEPYTGSDIILANITSTAADGQGYGTFYPYTEILCDGRSHRVTLTLRAYNGGLSGPADLQFGHEALTPDGAFGIISVWLDAPIMVQ